MLCNLTHRRGRRC